ncbi:XdhC family protein [Micromonospora sp. WMMD1120]|uniref:XdhC family protein n=1 Tax=Micromonospora sp. WMMD1120 TaxID=3016106 RepID=UPI002416BF9E|nr:XdhC/CoxI family protein [Micromonospora sp. WMMD1120]MDG4809455.1 XdhC family protein [Micromonospora sp. WMMD1120]
MRDVLDDVERWWRAGQPTGLATVVATWHSAPLPSGTTMLVAPDGTVTGNVSGGCVDSAVYELAREVIDTGRPGLHRYGVSGDEAFAVGLTCGGTIDVYVERVDPNTFPALPEVADAIRSGTPVGLVTCVDAGGDAPGGLLGRRLVLLPDRTVGTLGGTDLTAAVVREARDLLRAGRTATVHVGRDGQRHRDDPTFLVASIVPPPRMIIFGATDFGKALARMGAFLGYRTTIVDARRVFATTRRFPDADEVVVDWPHRYLCAEVEAGRVDERTVLCVLTHDPRFDVPLLELALRLPVAYIGALGSRRTHDERVARLTSAGVTGAELGRLTAPTGLDLGARTPQETAVSIAAELVALRSGCTCRPLRTLRGPIHQSTGVPQR